MRGKKAKELRHTARQVSGGFPERMYGRRSRQGPIENHPQTVRRVYQTLKARAKGKPL